MLVVLAYANSLENGFAFDDAIVIVDNELITHLDTLPALLTSDYWVAHDDSYGAVPFRSGLYRPLVLLSYAVNYAIGGRHPLGYHLVNIVLHLLVTCLLYFLALRLGFSRSAALIGAVLFAVHPIHTEAVTSIVGRAELLMALGVLGSWLLNLSGYYWWSLLAFAGGLFSKEQAIVLPVLLILSDVCSHRSLAAATSYRRYAGYVVVLAAYLAVRAAVLGTLSMPPVGFVENPLGSLEGVSRWLTAVKVAGYYLQLFFWPAALSADYSYNAIPVATSFWEPEVIGACIAWMALLTAFIWSFIRGERRISLSIGLTVLAFLPTSNFILPIGTMMGERLFYLPSAGLCLLIGWILGWAIEGRGSLSERIDGSKMVHATFVRYGAWAIVAIVCAGCIGRTIVRNRDWIDTERLFNSAVRVVPQSAKVHVALGRTLKFRNDHSSDEQALEHYQMALAIYPGYATSDPEFSSHMGDILFRLGRMKEAITALEQGTKLDPHVGLYLGLAYARLGETEKAERAWREVLTFTPHDPEARSRLSRLLLERGQWNDGLAQADEALRHHPDHVLALFNRALALEALGRSAEAMSAYERVIAIPSAPDAAKQDARHKMDNLRRNAEPKSDETRPCPSGLTPC
jgi:Flp pilus assembly protein TadD